MNFLQAIILGLVQGIAEFLPISSSGHLAIFQNLLHFDVDAQALQFYDVLLHLATLAVIFIVFWKDIKEMLLELLCILHLRRRPRREKQNPLPRRMILFILFGTLPLVLALLVKDSLEALSGNLFFIATMLVITGCLLYLSTQRRSGAKTLREATLRDILLVGIGQMCAVVPGLSRSGTTVSVGLFRNFELSFAVRFSFLLSIPAVLGANLLSLVDAIKAGIDWSMLPMYLTGMAVAFVSGLASVRFLQRIVRRKKFGGFAYYCWGAALVTLCLALIS